jgi:hypothetical protein
VRQTTSAEVAAVRMAGLSLPLPALPVRLPPMQRYQ